MHTDEKGQAEVTWGDAAQQLAEELDGTYLLRTDRTDLAEAELWKLYVLLARIEQSFRYLKSTLGIRPVFHQRTERVDAHIFISLLAYHLLHTIERRLQENGDHRSWPTIRDLLATHQMVPSWHRWEAAIDGVGACYRAADTGYPAAATRETVTKENDETIYGKCST